MSTVLVRSCCLFVSMSALAAGLFAQSPAPKVDFPAASPTATLKQRVGLTDIEVVYSRPGVKGREIFGGLVPWGEVWRTGANNATKITFSKAVKLEGKAIPAGTYELFSIPNRDTWTVIIHQNKAEWGAYSYDAAGDVARVDVKPVHLAEAVESFTIDLNDLRDDSATLTLTWDHTQVPVKLAVDDTAELIPQIEAVMASDAPKKPYAQAAMFYLDHNLDLKKAATWMDAAIAAQPDAYYLVYRKALILEKLGDKVGAAAAAKSSIDIATKAGGPAKEEYIRLNNALLTRVQ